MIFVTDASGKATYISREWRVLTGQSLAEAVDYGWSRVVHPEDVELIRNAVFDAIAGRSAFSVRYRVMATDGRVVWVTAGAVPSFGPPDSTFLGFLGSITLLDEPPAAGASVSLGRSDPPAALPDPGPRSALETVADHLLAAHALIVRAGSPGALAAVETALLEIGREFARAAQADPDESMLH